MTLHLKGKKNHETKDFISFSFDEPIYISTSKQTDLSTVKKRINTARKTHLKTKEKYGKSNDLYDAMQSVLAWDIINEPYTKGVITPVSRIWNCGDWNGWVLFDWDTYFAAYMLAIDNKELAFANAIAITKEITKSGFIPNFGSGCCRAEDRSQPPVGSLIVKEIYKNYHDKEFLIEVFDELLTWNRWWGKNRDIDGYLTWGSDPVDVSALPKWLSGPVGKKGGAQWESGLDNSPMWDDITFDPITHRLLMADVGLMSLYISDCQSLSEIAMELDKPKIAIEIKEREKKYTKKLQSLWDEEFGLYLNKNLVTGKSSYLLSPTLFYPLIAKVPNQEKAEQMIKKHYFNPEEFYGEYILPSIARNDPAFKDNAYWRGRIWAPMNFLVYLGLRNYTLPNARKDLVKKSANLLLKSWKKERYIYENYNAVTGTGDNVKNSDKSIIGVLY